MAEVPSCYAISKLSSSRGLAGASTVRGVRMVSRRFAKRSLGIGIANAQAGVDAALTIAARTQSLMTPGGRPNEKAREARLMVQEKVDAAGGGAFRPQHPVGRAPLT